MKVKIKRLDRSAVIPKYAKDGDAGLDLTATAYKVNEKGQYIYTSDLALEIPDGYVGLLFPRSSICNKDLEMTNSVGVIDSNYRGPIKSVFNPTCEDPEIYELGERFAQLIIIPYPKIEFEEVEELSETERGIGGYGSTGK
jgi:dUTP diphosphatase|nr:MAG TPA: dUTPase [Caudoviricetes sp.]